MYINLAKMSYQVLILLFLKRLSILKYQLKLQSRATTLPRAATFE
jgi:hypothetical protein